MWVVIPHLKQLEYLPFSVTMALMDFEQHRKQAIEQEVVLQRLITDAFSLDPSCRLYKFSTY